MTGKERVAKAIKCESVDRVPWVPFVGVHAGALLGIKADVYLKSEDYMVKGVQAAIDRYKPDGIPVTFDLQLEAEVLGCELNWSEDNPPAVISHPLANGTALADLSVPSADAGRIGAVLSTTRKLRAANPDIALYGLITGPFTLALHMLGTDIFMKMFDAPDEIHALMKFCQDVGNAMSDYLIEAGCDVIAVVDPMTSQIGPDQFQEFVTQYATNVFEHIRKNGALGSFFVCGHAQQNVEIMCQCGCDSISVDENIPLQFVREVCQREGVSFGGNMQLTTVLLLGKPVDAQKNAIECLEIAGDKGFILAPGCDIPYATPPENLEAICEIVADEYKRDTVKAMVSQSDDGDRLDMAEYGQQDKVIVDIITLDSEGCAPCQYMVDAVRKITPAFDGIVEWREHKIKYRESLVFMSSLMVRNIPTICIDGQITFVSRIPPRDELIAAIQNRINEKMRIRIKQKKGTVFLIGEENDETAAARDVLERAIAELGTDVDLVGVTDEKIFAEFGLVKAQTPAVVTAKYRQRSSQRTPELAAVKEWLKELS